MKLENSEFYSFLSHYEEDETIYRTIYELRKNSPHELTLYLNSLSPELLTKKHLAIPELTEPLPEPILISFDSLAPVFVNVLLSKHYRYTPAFLHEHDFFEVAYVYEGSVTSMIQGEEHVLNTGDIYIIPPNTIHNVAVFNDSLLINIMIKQAAFQSTFWELLSTDTVLSRFFSHVLFHQTKGNYLLFHTGNDQRIQNIIANLYSEFLDHEKFKDLRIMGLLMELWVLLLRYHEQDNFAVITSNNASISVAAIFEYINKNYQNVTLSSISEYFGFYPSHLSTLIKKYTGQTFIQIVRSVKLQKAAQALTHTNLTINEICELIGYESPEHFMRTFKKEYHMTPSEYRALQRSEQ